MKYRICTKTVMDTTDPDITFDERGVSNHYYYHKEMEKLRVLTGEAGREQLARMSNTIRKGSEKKAYDCILGLSGGTDSTFLCLLAKELGLRPLVVHFDNGWNSELAVHNIENTVTKLDFDLFTYVVDWDEFKELQRAYFAAHVVDIEVLTDHGFMAVLHQQAMKHGIRYVLAGMNIATESILAPSWIYNKSDLGNIEGIVRAHGTRPFESFKSFPSISPLRRSTLLRINRVKVFSPLNWVDYRYEDVKRRIIAELGWRDYGGKHYESVFTRFYQGYILPRKFKFDKRRGHLSSMICSGQMTREQALRELEKPSLPSELAAIDRRFVLKKLGFSESEFDEYLAAPPVPHVRYGTSPAFAERFPWLRWAVPVVRRILR